MPTIDEIIDKHTYTFSVTECVVQDVDKLRAAIESAIREARDAVKDCRTCKHHYMCTWPEQFAERGCTNGDQYQPTQPVRLWEK